MRTIKRTVAIVLVVAFGLYFRQRWIDIGKVTLWSRLIEPFFSWRHIPLQTKTRNGHVLRGYLDDFIFLRLYFFGTWEPAITAYLLSALKDGDTMIDVGANIGVHTVIAAECVGPQGRVHAIEASPTIFALLQQTLTENSIRNVVAHNVAVVEERRLVKIYRHDPTNLGGSTITAHRVTEHADAYVEEAVIDGMPLLDVVGETELRAARVIKIDVEGAELDVLRGMLPHASILRDDVAVIVEYNPDSLAESGLDRIRFLRLMESHGFVPYELPHSLAVQAYLGGVDLSPRPLLSTTDRPVDLLFIKGRTPLLAGAVS